MTKFKTHQNKDDKSSRNAYIKSRGIGHRIGALFLVLGLLYMSLGVSFAETALESTPFLDDHYKVLFLSSYSETFITSPDVLKGIRSVFEEETVVMDTEFMDTKRFPGEENLENFYQSFVYKLSHTYPYDAIIVADDAALQFVIDHQEALFNEIPVFFIGINDYDRAYAASQNPYITGIYEKMSLIEDNLDIAIRINPDAKRIVAVTDNTITGQGDEKEFLEAASKYPDYDFQVLRSSDYSFEALGQKMASFDKQTILVVFTISVDQNQDYMNIKEQFEFIRNHTYIPVYRIGIAGVGSSGLLGGKMIDYEGIGKLTAESMMTILNGKPVQEMGLVGKMPYQYLFDNEVLEKYNIDKRLLPEGAIILNEKISPLEQYRSYIILAGLIMLFLAMMAAVLMFDNMKRRKIQIVLTDTNHRLSILSQKYETAMASTNSAVWELNPQTLTLDISKHFEKIFDKKLPQGQNLYRLIEHLTEADYQLQAMDIFQDYIENQKGDINIILPINDDHDVRRWMLMRGNGIFDHQKKLIAVTGIILDITNEREKQEYMTYYAKHDFLTGLPNRLDFEETLQNELDYNQSGTLMLFDIDDFKSINDTMGHAFGDEILIQMAKRLSTMPLDNLYVSRMGGDEFFLILKQVTDKEEIRQTIHQINEVIAKPFSHLKIEEYISFSMGVSIYPEDSRDINQLMMNVDTAMYYVKKNGKNNFEFYYEEMKNELKKRKHIEKLIRTALKEDGFMLYYQPQIDALTGEIIGFEALIRFKEGEVGPGTFIPIAEETGDIIMIGRWVVKEALKQMRLWQDKGWGPKKIAINYSVQQLNDLTFLDYLIQMANQYQIDPKYIEIEITERIFLEKSEMTMVFLKKLRAAGFSLSLDDFGSGYSSLSYLTYLPVNIIKLDKSINDKFLDMEDTQVMESIISLAHGLDLVIVAEGIEEKLKFDRIKACGCDIVQGYLFSKPLPASEIQAIYNHHYDV